MPVSLHKNLKVVATDDTFILKMENTYDFLKNYLIAKYTDLSHEITYADILIAASQTYEVEYINVPTGGTFKWYINGTEITTSKVNVLSGTTITYELTFADGSKCVGEQIIDDDFILNCELMQPNQFLVTITSDKTISYLNVTRYRGTPEQTSYSVTTFDDNTYSFYANDNESISLFPLCSDYTYDDKSLNNYGHSYNYTITQNTQCNALFPYVAWRAYNIALKDENGQEITNISQYWDNIVISGDSSKIEYKRESFSSYFAIWTYPNTTFNYTININGYSPISDTGCTDIDIRVYKTLIPMCSYTMTPIPADATVTLAANGYNTVSGTGTQSITVAKGTTVMWMLQRQGYGTISDTIVINSDLSETKEMERGEHSLDITDYNYTLDENYNLTLTYWTKSTNDVVVPNV